MKKLIYIGILALGACKKDTLTGVVQGSYKGSLINFGSSSNDTLNNYTIEIQENEEGLVYQGYTVYPGTNNTKTLWYYHKSSGDNLLIDITYFVEGERIYVGTQTVGLPVNSTSTFSGVKL